MNFGGISALCFISMNTALYAFGADAGDLLRTADRLADAGNWAAAREPYAQAEQLFRAQGDKRNELYAKFGRLHRDVEAGSYSQVLREVQADLSNPVVQKDPSLKIRALSLKGTIDLNLNTAAAKIDYSEIRDLARSIGDVKWENRAAGELGIIAGLNGDLGTAGVALFGTINKAAELHDLAAQMNFSIWLANGMAVNGMADRALKVLDKAVDAARNDPGAGIPIQLHIARVRALVNLPEGPQRDSGVAQAQKLIDETMASARASNTLGAQAELLNQSGLIAEKRGDLTSAAKYYSQTAEIARKADLPRMEASALYYAAKIYRSQKQLSRAGAAIDTAIEQQNKAQELFDLPLYLAEKAEIETDLHHVAIADRLYVQATALTESLLLNVSSSRVKSSLIETMGAVYLGHFRLALMTLHSAAKAFNIVESARGRSLADTLLSTRTTDSSPAPTPADLEISRIQNQLRRPSNSVADMKRLQTKLDDAYSALVPIEYARDRSEVTKAGKPVPLQVLQNELRPGEALLEYVLTDGDHSYAFEITKAQVRLHPLASRKEIETVAQKFVRAVRSKTDASESARALFDLVVAPALSSRADAVTIVPDGALHFVPFAALRDEKNEFWMNSTSVTSSPSATVFHRLRSVARATTATKPFLGVAFSPGESGSKENNARVASFGEHPMNLKPLPYAQQEVQAAARVFGDSSVLLQGRSRVREFVAGTAARGFQNYSYSGARC